jgi:hypothetical protein
MHNASLSKYSENSWDIPIKDIIKSSCPDIIFEDSCFFRFFHWNAVCVLNQVRQLYQNSKDVPYMGHFF